MFYKWNESISNEIEREKSDKNKFEGKKIVHVSAIYKLKYWNYVINDFLIKYFDFQSNRIEIRKLKIMQKYYSCKSTANEAKNWKKKHFFIFCSFFFFHITLCNNSNYHELLTLCSITKLFEKKFPFSRLFFNYLIVDFHSNTHFRFSLKPEYGKWKSNEYYSWVYYQLECSRMHFIHTKKKTRIEGKNAVFTLNWMFLHLILRNKKITFERIMHHFA